MQLRASEASMAISTARLFRTGSVPGRPRQTGQTLVFGGSPKRVEQPQKIFVLVRSWTWTSRPMTGWYFARISGAMDIVSEADFGIKETNIIASGFKGSGNALAPGVGADGVAGG